MKIELPPESLSPQPPPMKLHFALVVMTMLFTTGCSGSKEATYPVHGIVRFPDGNVLREGTVEFETLGREEPVTAFGDIQPDGTFTLGTYDLDDGAFAGKHRAIVVSDVAIGNGAERPGLIRKTQLHSKFRSYKYSKLEFEVKPGRNDLVVEVDYADPASETAETVDSLAE